MVFGRKFDMLALWKWIPFRRMSPTLARRTLIYMIWGSKKPQIKNLALPRRASYSTDSSVSIKNAFKTYNLDSEPSSHVSLTREDAEKYVRQMLEIRRAETVSANLYKSKQIRGFCHLVNGQEAVCVGLKAAMRKDDAIITAYRCHGYTYLMGVSIQGVLGELLGRSCGCSRGKGGSMHMYSKNFYGGNGIVGAQVPLGAGVALAQQYKGMDAVTMSLYGDGAANQGQVFEAYNIACLWKLPCIFVCENNLYAMGTKAERGACCTEYYTRGHYIPGIWVDGNQVLAVRSAVEFAIDYALKNGPIVMEMNTYRYMGHSMSDPGTSYRTREEVQESRRRRDPITMFKDLIVSMGYFNEGDLKQMELKIRKDIEDIAKRALADKEIDLKELSKDVYSINIEKMIRGVIQYDMPATNMKPYKGKSPVATPKDQMKDPTKPGKKVPKVESAKVTEPKHPKT